MEDEARPLPDGSGEAELEAAADRAAISAILEARGRNGEAVAALQQALALLEHVLGANHYEVAVALDRLATLCRQERRQQDAVPLYNRAIDIFERTLGPGNVRTVTCRANRNRALLEIADEGHGHG